MFLSSIALVQTLPCLAEPGKIIVVGVPLSPIDKVLPYLAALPNAISYAPERCALTLRRQPGFITLYADKVYITQVSDVNEGLQLLAALTDAINATWVHRSQLKPVVVRQRAPRLLDVWTLLPRTNCRQCAEATCMAFAAALLQGRRTLVECAPLANDQAMIEHKAALEAML